MMERLLERGAAIGAAGVERAIGRLASAIDLPPGISVERSARGIVLIGRQLKLRLIRDVRLRNITALAQGLMR